MSDVFDFGFTAVDEYELEAVQQAQTVANELSSGANDLEERLNKLYNAILPLLSSLKANPDKDYIYWPNRVEKVEAFEDHISQFIKD